MKRNLSLALPFAGILIRGSALRFYRIGDQSLWFDELLSVSISRLPLMDVFRVSGSVDPPLYCMLLHYWMGLGSGDGALRSLSALASIVTIAVVYVLAVRLFDLRVGLISALLFAVAPCRSSMRKRPACILS